MTVRMKESANTGLKDKSDANLAFVLQFFSISDTHKDGCIPFSCFLKALALVVDCWGVRF